jgi:hypothetical protein
MVLGRTVCSHSSRSPGISTSGSPNSRRADCPSGKSWPRGALIGDQQALLLHHPVEFCRHHGRLDARLRAIPFQGLGREVGEFNRLHHVFILREPDRFAHRFRGLLARPLEEDVVRRHDCFLEVAIEHVDSDTVAAQVLDALAGNRRVVIFDSDVHLPDPRTRDVPGATPFWMASVQARLERGEEDAAVQALRDALALQQDELGMVARRTVRALLRYRSTHHLDRFLHHGARIEVSLHVGAVRHSATCVSGAWRPSPFNRRRHRCVAGEDALRGRADLGQHFGLIQHRLCCLLLLVGRIAVRAQDAFHVDAELSADGSVLELPCQLPIRFARL